MSLFKKRERTNEQPKAGQQSDECDPAPLLGRVGDGHTLESGERIARELRELQELRRRRGTNADTHVSADPELPIPNPAADRRKR